MCERTRRDHCRVLEKIPGQLEAWFLIYLTFGSIKQRNMSRMEALARYHREQTFQTNAPLVKTHATPTCTDSIRMIWRARPLPSPKTNLGDHQGRHSLLRTSSSKSFGRRRICHASVISNSLGNSTPVRQASVCDPLPSLHRTLSEPIPSLEPEIDLGDCTQCSRSDSFSRTSSSTSSTSSQGIINHQQKDHLHKRDHPEQKQLYLSQATRNFSRLAAVTTRNHGLHQLQTAGIFECRPAPISRKNNFSSNFLRYTQQMHLTRAAESSRN